ncbi:transcription-repair-coupling factor [Youhaiella tibetensis]|uniref:Transcription-repair-coupling factor n=1 Tax=Paradevosia tibetensis TaxID=1447062 RepID=A0A5B9DND7_9HYPH|nr:transcription-repair coupling factor [Youhaiella tibetensis]QEE20526.1 transcription-repair coupling factor [Youhaiella tibetensis]GGF23363.1 transcription-repair-coupling factor [Youhaiella tibetensis]
MSQVPVRTISNVPDGMQAVVLARLVEERLKADPEAAAAAVFVARDGRRLQRMAETLAQLLPGHAILTVPAWDCLPYDRVSPNTVTIAERMKTLAALTDGSARGAVVLTAVNALVQRLIPREVTAGMSFSAAAGKVVASDKLIAWAANNGYLRVPTVREAGEYAVRGGIVDLFPAGQETPLRFDFFGSQLETIRTFDPDSQRTTGNIKTISLAPMSEAVLAEDTIRRFRRNYTATFGGNTADDPLYAAVSAGQRFPGVEHWLPFFYEDMSRLADYTGDAPFVFDDQAKEAFAERQQQIADYYDARQEARQAPAGATSGAPYKPIEPGLLYEMEAPAYAQAGTTVVQLSPFSAPGGSKRDDAGGRLAHNFAAERQAADTNLFEAVVDLLKKNSRAGRRTIIACWSTGTRDRMAQVLHDHGLKNPRMAENWRDAETTSANTTALVVLGLDTGFETDDLLVLSEQDILGERILRPQRRKKASDALTEAASLAAGDLVVHVDHGIGRFVGLKVIEAGGAPHECVEIEYAKGDKLYLPVENIELLSRYGSEETGAELDRLGGVAWQAKKGRLKKRIREMAEQLIKIAAARQLTRSDPIALPTGAYEDFAARFPYEETEDQLVAIEAVLDDLTSGRVMDRLVCGDVGFGKTEVALRAAFAVAMSGKQVAVVVPTTLLARQHLRTFKERFAGLPVNVAGASRLIPSAELKATKEGLESGHVDIVVGTHALLSKSIKFKDLGLLIIDEEQHFGVGHKERLKELKANVHVLTLTATPIPRTLQLALTGVRDLSLLATPPVDRLAVRTFVSPFDPLSIREALLREKYRGGQAFYVVPRIKDQPDIAEFLTQQVPEVSFVVANGQMAPGELDDIMNAFYDGKFDVLVATTIVESGLDIPNANTLVVHRADNFGLAQLYQIRGRIGRSKARAYALFTIPPDRKLTDTAERRLGVLQSLESLGAGFQLASHDLDIRGAGNLLGEEQSGHIREVGYELYQSMLEEAVASLRSGEEVYEEKGEWSPQISIGMPVMIPEYYVPDLQLRMQLYRRLGDLTDAREIDAAGAELIDRFGPLPEEVEALLKIILVKSLCRAANVEKVDAGPKGAIITFRNSEFADPVGLVKLVADPGQQARVRPDQKIVFARNWPSADARLKGTAAILSRLAKLAEAGRASVTVSG